MSRRVTLLLTIALTFVWTGVALAFLRALGPDWAVFTPATCLGTHCFCESPRTGELLLQPANSWSSLGFVVVGGWISLRSGHDRDSALGILPSLWLGLCVIIIGIGSLALHATLTLWGQFADVLGMYLFGSFVLVRALARWRGLGTVAAVFLYLAIAGTLIALLGIAPETRRWLFAVLLVAAIAAEWGLARRLRPGAQPDLFVAGLAANLLAFSLWIADQTLVLCDRGSLLQGHAAWHLLGAVAVACSYGYYRGERRAG